MLATAQTCAVVGLDGYIVQVEVDISPGLPAFNIVGLPDAAVQEARERVRAALRNSGFEFPMRRITANLAPADLKKAGPGYDVPIAVSILLSSGQLTGVPEGVIFLGDFPWTAACGTPTASWPWPQWPASRVARPSSSPRPMPRKPRWWKASRLTRSKTW